VSAPILFGASYSVYTRIARLALVEKGVEHAFSEIDIFADGGPAPDYLRRHPFARIPAFSHDGFELFETQAICRYVDEAFPGPALQPADAKGRARMVQIIGILDAYAYRAMVWDIFVERVRKPAQGKPADEERIAAAVEASERCLAVIERLMGDAAWLAGGDAPSLADLHAAPMLIYLAAAPEGGALIARHPRIVAWLERMKARSSMRLTPTPLVD
jgi:glutathione S-transferase